MKFLKPINRTFYAIGDCAQYRNPLPGRKAIEQVWYTGRIHGETLGETLAGKNFAYNPGPWFNSAKFFDIEYQPMVKWMLKQVKEKSLFIGSIQMEKFASGLSITSSNPPLY